MIKFYICRGPLYWRQNFEIWTNHGLCLFFFKVNKACYWSKGKTSTSKYFSNLHSDLRHCVLMIFLVQKLKIKTLQFLAFRSMSCIVDLGVFLQSAKLVKVWNTFTAEQACVELVRSWGPLPMNARNWTECKRLKNFFGFCRTL